MSFSRVKNPSPPNKQSEPLGLEDGTDYDDHSLAARLRIALATLRAWRSRSPEKLPPGVKVGRNWLYNKAEVEDWLKSKRTGRTLATTATAPELVPALLKRRGKPTAKETEEARAAGLTVPALRAQKAGAQK